MFYRDSQYRNPGFTTFHSWWLETDHSLNKTPRKTIYINYNTDAILRFLLIFDGRYSCVLEVVYNIFLTNKL